MIMQLKGCGKRRRRPVFRRLVRRGVLSQAVVLTGRGEGRRWTLAELGEGGPC